MGILDTRMGSLLEPEMGTFWSLMLLPMVPNVTLSGYGLYLCSVDSREELLLTNMSQELFLPRIFLLAVFGKEFFPGEILFSGFSPKESFPRTFILGEVIS
jgi:hypothetical protein